MGCDIHSMIEVNKPYEWMKNGSKNWVNAGEGFKDRNYEIFAVIGNVRNDENIPFIAENRFSDLNNVDASSAFCGWLSSWGGDAHSASYVTLAEIKVFDADQRIYSHRIICGKNKNNEIVSTCAPAYNETREEVGECNIFGPWGNGSWKNLISSIEKVRDFHEIKSDEDIRLVFFFDN